MDRGEEGQRAQGERYAHVSLEVEPETRARQAVPSSDSPFRILVLVDLSGARERPPLARRVPVMLDRDNFDDVMARLAPAVRAGNSIISFRELDDFHADRLWERLPIFEALRDLRERLASPRTFESAARVLLQGSAPSEPTASTPVRTGSLLDQIVFDVSGPLPPGATPPAPSGDELQEEIRRIVRPHIVPGEDPRKAGLTERVDTAATELLRGVLHDSAFQALESAWRALYFMVRRMETSAQLGLYVIDVSREELSADLNNERGLEATALHRWLIEGLGRDPWSVVVGDFTFGLSDDDLTLLSRTAAIARKAGAPFLAAASPALAGAPEFEKTPEPEGWSSPEHPVWNAFRRSSAASFVGLALPRFLARLPYGQDAEPCAELAFEEMASPTRHTDYLWANPAYAVALLLAESFTEAGWKMRPGTHQDIGGLPLHMYSAEGVTHTQPCAESLMTDRAAARLIECGLMPLASMKDVDAVRLVRFQSVALPAAALAGPW